MDTDIRVNFGNKVRELRHIRKMSQEMLSETLGINSASLSAIETGKSFASCTTIMNICKVFNISPKELFDFNVTDLDSNSVDIIREINTVLPELDNEKLIYLHKIAKMFAENN